MNDRYEDFGGTRQSRDVILSTNEFCFLQSKTNGSIKSHVGPTTVTISQQEVLVVFDPASNKAIMGSLFDHFLTKIEDEEGTYVSLHYEKKNEKDNSTALVAIVDGEEITTDYYNNDSLKYVEMMRHLNESIDTDLHNMDSEAKPIEDNTTVTRRKPKRKKVF